MQDSLTAPVCFLRLPEVLKRTGLSKSTIYELIAGAAFPAPVVLSRAAVGWVESELIAWQMDRMEARPRTEQLPPFGQVD